MYAQFPSPCTFISYHSYWLIYFKPQKTIFSKGNQSAQDFKKCIMYIDIYNSFYLISTKDGQDNDLSKLPDNLFPLRLSLCMMMVGSSDLLSKSLAHSVFVDTLSYFFVGLSEMFSLLPESLFSRSVSFSRFPESPVLLTLLSALGPSIAVGFFLTFGKVDKRASNCSLVREVLVRLTSTTSATLTSMHTGSSLRSTSPRSRTFKVPGRDEKRACTWPSVKWTCWRKSCSRCRRDDASKAGGSLPSPPESGFSEMSRLLSLLPCCFKLASTLVTSLYLLRLPLSTALLRNLRLSRRRGKILLRSL